MAKREQQVSRLIEPDDWRRIRAAGGLDDPANLITLCDGCHAARHPNLQASLARRVIERWSLRLAHGSTAEATSGPWTSPSAPHCDS